MVRRLLLTAVVVAAAAAVGEHQKVLEDCGTGTQTYKSTTAAFCPTSRYPYCDITKMIVEPSKISCPGKRSQIVYRNNSVVWLSTDHITCIDGVLKNAEGEKLFNLLRPNCAFKAKCDACTAEFQSNCPAGMSCKPANLKEEIAQDGCRRLQCADGTLKLYNANGAQMDYQARQLLCTVVGKWSNYSIDGSIVGGPLINETITANCAVNKACENCVEPKLTMDGSQLPAAFAAFRTGEFVHVKKEGSCSLIQCARGSTLYGFSGSSKSVTGLEYTSKGFLKCSANSQWTNGGLENTPSNFFVACLSMCDPYDEIVVDGGASIICENHKNIVVCANKKRLKIDTKDGALLYEELGFTAGKGWRAFDSIRDPKTWENAADIKAVTCED